MKNSKLTNTRKITQESFREISDYALKYGKAAAGREFGISSAAVETCLWRAGRSDKVTPTSRKRMASVPNPEPTNPPIEPTVSQIAAEVLRQALEAIAKVDQAGTSYEYCRKEMEKYRVAASQTLEENDCLKKKLARAEKDLECVRTAYNTLVKDSNVNGLPQSVDDLMLLLRRSQKPGQVLQ
jgi:hypothetical protein